MASPPSDCQALVHFIAWYATQLGRAGSRIRRIEFLYLADAHLFSQRQRLATGYPWRFYHYGPYAPEVQRDIDECVRVGLIESQTMPRSDEAGDVFLYGAHGDDPLIYDRSSPL
jgi:hypothetical protein